MRHRLVVLALATLGIVRLDAAAEEPARIAQVAWLSGCWVQQTGQTTVEEHWMPPRGGTMLSVGRTTRNGNLVEYEFVALREQDSRLAYQAHPSGQPTTTFLSIQVGEDVVVFEDPAHDFPQRVGYRKAGADALDAWIEGTVRGQPRRVDFKYRSQSCVEP
ncbi:MAG: DUF6265 family protein [Vicinamibacterales bacterium]